MFDEELRDAVLAFQSTYGLTVDGVVGRNTWNAIQNVYEQTLYQLPANYQTFARQIYPGHFLVEGDTGAEVTLLQTQLNRLAQRDSALPSVTADGIFGAATAAAVRTLQSRLGYSPTGAVGPVPLVLHHHPGSGLRRVLNKKRTALGRFFSVFHTMRQLSQSSQAGNLLLS